MKKKIAIMLIFILIMVLPFQILAQDDEETDYIWLKQEIEIAQNIKGPVIYSKSAVIYDRGSKTILYGKNEHERLPMASTTKIMTAIILVENVSDLSKEIEVVKEAAMVGGSSLELKTGDKITYEGLLYGLLLCSGNDAAAQIAISMAGSIEEFADLMNAKAYSLGLKDTHFITPHGLDEEGHYTTAYELAVIADYALNMQKIAEVVSTKNYTIAVNGYPRALTNTNELLGYLEGVNGVKTGFTHNAGRCLVTSAIRDNFNIITVVLGADTKKIRTRDSINLIEYVYKNYKLINLEDRVEEAYQNWKLVNENRIEITKGIPTSKIEVKLGKIKYTKYPIRKESLENINIDIKTYKLKLNAPVKENYQLANIIISIDNKEIMRVPIEIKKEIAKKGIKEYIIETLELLSN